MSGAQAVNVGGKRAISVGIIIGTAGSLFGSLLLEPVRAFVGSAWWLVTVVAGAIWGGLTAWVPVWVVIAVVTLAVFVALRAGRSAAHPAARDVAVGGDEPTASPVLDDVEDGVLRRLARADGEWLTTDELGTAKTRQLRLAQALERLIDLGLVEDDGYGTQYGLTGRGRDFVIWRE